MRELSKNYRWILVSCAKSDRFNSNARSIIGHRPYDRRRDESVRERGEEHSAAN